MATINTFTDYNAQKQDIERRRRMAEMLQQQSMQPLDTNQTAGGYVVPVSWTQGLAKMLQAYSGRKGLDEAEGRSKELSAQRNQALAEAIRGMPQGTPGTAGVPEQEFQPTGADYADNPNLATNEQGMVNVPAQAGAPAQPASWQDQAAWMGKLGQIGPDATQIGSTILGMQQKDTENAENRQARLEQAKLIREGHMLQLQARLADSRLSAKDKADTARELQMMRDQSAAERQKERLAAEQRMRQFAIENRQPQQPQIIQSESGPMMLPRGGTQAVSIMGPDGKPLQGKSTEKALPTSAAQKLMENSQNLRRAEQALQLVSQPEKGTMLGQNQDPNATGWKGYLPDAVLQRVDPQGVSARAAIGDIGSMVIHDRSGAAVSAHEFPRLRPFIPSATDNPDTVRKKLSRFVQEYRAVVDEAADFYRSSGYRVPSETLRGANNAPRTAGVPQGVDPAVWNVMTPEEKALWTK